MNVEIVSALIALIGTIIGSFGGIIISSKLSNYRIEQLEKKVEKHNNLIERVYHLEQRDAVFDEELKVVDHRICKLENEMK